MCYNKDTKERKREQTMAQETLRVLAVSKDKNFVIFSTNRPYNYVFDINTGTWYGNNHKQLVNTPPAVSVFLSRNRNNFNSMPAVVKLLATYRNSSHISPVALRVVDKVGSLGYNVAPYGDDYYMVQLEKNFKEFKSWAENQVSTRPNDRYCLYIPDFITYLNNKQYGNIVKKYCSENISKQLFDILVDYAKRYVRDTSNEKDIALSCYWVERTLGFRHMIISSTYDRTIVFEEPQHQYYKSGIYNDLNDIFKMAKTLNVKLEKSDFEKQYIALKKNYMVARLFNDNTKIKELYSKYANKVAYSNDKYTVVLLDSVEKLCLESGKQSNCIAYNYIPRIINGETVIVSIRDNENLEEPLVSCEIDIYDGHIKQYLGRFNCHIGSDDSDLYRFRTEYAKHLKNMWLMG